MDGKDITDQGFLCLGSFFEDTEFKLSLLQYILNFKLFFLEEGNFFNVPSGNLQLTPHRAEWYTTGCEAIQMDLKRPKKWQEAQKEKGNSCTC